MTAPTVSVVLPTHNRTETLPRSIGSVLHQSFTDLELLVVDDASDEDVQSVVNAFADERVHYIRRSEQGGPAAARNTGIEQARGAYLAFQDSDDEWLLDKLTKQIEFIQRQPEDVALVSCGILGYSKGRDVAPFQDPEISDSATSDLLKLIKSLAFAYTQTWLLRRDAIESAGLFDEQILIWEDRELFIRIAQKNAVRYLPEVLVIAYRQPDSLSQRVEPRIRSLERMIEKNRPRSDRDQRFLAWLNYLVGRSQLQVNELSASRGALWRSLRLWPWFIKPWALLLMTFLRHPLPARVLPKNPDQ